MATKTMYRVQLPYNSPSWPTLLKDDERRIVQNLEDLMTPIGGYRRHIEESWRDKRYKKRQRRDGSQNNVKAEDTPRSEVALPQIFDYLTIGFNSTVRALETLSKGSKPAIIQDAISDTHGPAGAVPALGAVFVCESGRPKVLTCSMPLLIATASLAQPRLPPIRLVQLSASAENRLAEALHQPRVGFIGVQVAAPDADFLLALVRAAVDPVKTPWLEDCASSPRYLPVKIENMETSVGSKKPRKTVMQPGFTGATVR